MGGLLHPAPAPALQPPAPVERREADSEIIMVVWVRGGGLIRVLSGEPSSKSIGGKRSVQMLYWSMDYSPCSKFLIQYICTILVDSISFC